MRETSSLVDFYINFYYVAKLMNDSLKKGQNNQLEIDFNHIL